MSLLIFISTLLVYFFSSPGETVYNYFSLLAFAFSKGNFYINIQPVAHLSELIPINVDKYYIPYAPMPAILLTPFTFLSKNLVGQTFFSIFSGALIGVVVFKIALIITKNKKQALFMSLFSSFGTNLWYMASIGSSWYFAQVVACLFLLLAILTKLKNKNSFLVGVFLGAAYLSRPHVILSLPFFIIFNNTPRHPRSRVKPACAGKHGMTILIGILPFMFFNFYYNFARFGVIWDKGYALIPGVLEEPWYEKGIFHWSYIPRHIQIIFFKLPDKILNFPYFKPSSEGMALWLTSPALIILFFSNFKKRIVKLASLATFLIFIPISMHGTAGFSQFGYRFAIDFYPFLFLIMAFALKKHGVKKEFLFLLAISILINFWGVVIFNFFFKLV